MSLSSAMLVGFTGIQSNSTSVDTVGDNLANLNKVMLYVRRNETTNRIKIVFITGEEEVPKRLEQDLKFLDEAYPELSVEIVVMEGKFGPQLIAQLSREWKIPANFMFIGCPGQGMPHSLSELGGVRVIV